VNVLGLQAFYHNHAAALLADGKLAFFSEEEKLSRVKGAREGFPIHAVRHALEAGAIGLSDVAEIAYAWLPWRYTWTLLRGALGSLTASPRSDRRLARGDAVSSTADRILSLAQFLPPFLGPRIRQQIRHGGIAGPIPPIVFVPHHLAHAASAFFTSGMDEAAVVIVDGMGERDSTTIWHGRGTELKLLHRVGFPNSLGEFYAAFTEHAGFKTYQQEGKLMGLAAYGESDPALESLMDQVLQIEHESYRVNPAYTVSGAHNVGASFSDAFVDLFGPPRGRDEPLSDRHRALAFAAQDRLERATMEVVRRAARLTGSRNVCFSGGVAMNCKLNGVILESELTDRVSVLPASNDAGAALGAAMHRSLVRGADPRFELDHVYYGTGADESEMEDALQHVKAAYRRVGEAGPSEVAALLAERRVVALFTGRAEFGARALGARSILADPRDKGMWTVVNESVKRRENWRPFAPVILAGHEADWFIGGQPSHFMMKAFRVRPERRDQIPAVVHVDGTCRPQSIRRDQNATYHDIVAAFHERTGVPILMNTSFNVRGEPIVSTPLQALSCYFSTGMDALLMGPFLLRKDSE
jgi:carbamoyltransferase